MDIDVQSYRQVWHHKERADHLAWIFSVSTFGMVRIVEEPGSVRFFYRPTASRFRDTGAETLFAVINPNARISVNASWAIEEDNPF